MMPERESPAKPLEEANAIVEEEQRRKPWQPYLEAVLGFRNHWYPAFFSCELKEGEVGVGVQDPPGVESGASKEVKGEVLLGERILFRRVDGTVYALQDWCPHRGVSFSAKPECYTKNTLTCWYHAWTFDIRDGVLKTILTDPESPLIGKIKLKRYPVEERKGIVFVFIGDLDPPPPLEEDVQPGFLDEGLAVYPKGWSRLVRCNWRPAAENGFDAAHIYIHRNSPVVKAFKKPLALGTVPLSRNKGMRIVEGPGPKGIIKVGGEGKVVWEAEIDGVKVSSYYKPGQDGVIAGGLTRTSAWLPCGLKVDPFPIAGTIHFEWWVPVDEHTHKYMMTWGRQASSPEGMGAFYMEVENLWSHLIPNRFNSDDSFAREAMERFYAEEGGWHKERLYGPDIVITEWRKLASRYNRGIQKRGW